MRWVVAVAITLACDIALIPFAGVIIKDFWEWFIVPSFGQELLSLWEAVGLAIFVSFITYRRTKPDSEIKEAWQLTFNALSLSFERALTYLWYWLLGAIVWSLL